MTQTHPRTMTAEDLLAMSSGMGERYELIDGELIVTAAAGGRHGLVTGKFLGELAVFLKENPLGILIAGGTGFYTRGDDRTVRAPDLAFIRSEAVPAEGISYGYLRVAPDLVLEVVSPNDRAAEVDEKVQEWLKFGVKEIWVAYPAARRIMIFRRDAHSAVILNAGDQLDGGAILPGFQRMIDLFFG